CKQAQTIPLAPVINFKKKVSSLEWEYPENYPRRELDWLLAKQDQRVKASPGQIVIFHIKGMIKSGWHTFPTHQTSKAENAKYVATTSFIAQVIEPESKEPKKEAKEKKSLVEVIDPITTDRPTHVVHD